MRFLATSCCSAIRSAWAYMLFFKSITSSAPKGSVVCVCVCVCVCVSVCFWGFFQTIRMCSHTGFAARLAKRSVNLTAWAYFFGTIFMGISSLYYVAHKDWGAFDIPHEVLSFGRIPLYDCVCMCVCMCVCVCVCVCVWSFLLISLFLFFPLCLWFPQQSLTPLIYAVLVTSSFCYLVITFANKHISSTVVTAFWPGQVRNQNNREFKHQFFIFFHIF